MRPGRNVPSSGRNGHADPPARPARRRPETQPRGGLELASGAGLAASTANIGAPGVRACRALAPAAGRGRGERPRATAARRPARCARASAGKASEKQADRRKTATGHIPPPGKGDDGRGLGPRPQDAAALSRTASWHERRGEGREADGGGRPGPRRGEQYSLRPTHSSRRGDRRRASGRRRLCRKGRRISGKGEWIRPQGGDVDKKRTKRGEARTRRQSQRLGQPGGPGRGRRTRRRSMGRLSSRLGSPAEAVRTHRGRGACPGWSFFFPQRAGDRIVIPTRR